MASSKALNRKHKSEDFWANHAPPGMVRCTAHRKDGKQCRQEAVATMTVCPDHGGSTPAAIRSAIAKLGNTVEEISETVARIALDNSEATRDQLVAAQMVYKVLAMEKEIHEHSIKVDPIEHLFTQILADPQGLAAPTAMQALPAGEAPRYDDGEGPAWEDLIGAREGHEDGAEDVVDAELVDEPAPARQPREPKQASAAPPQHIREGLARTEYLRRKGLW
jgi:hypothetical protein